MPDAVVISTLAALDGAEHAADGIHRAVEIVQRMRAAIDRQA